MSAQPAEKPKKDSSRYQVPPRKAFNLRDIDLSKIDVPGAPDLTQEDLDRVDNYFLSHAADYDNDEYVMDRVTGRPRVFHSALELWRYIESDEDMD